MEKIQFMTRTPVPMFNNTSNNRTNDNNNNYYYYYYYSKLILDFSVILSQSDIIT